MQAKTPGLGRDRQSLEERLWVYTDLGLKFFSAPCCFVDLNKVFNFLSLGFLKIISLVSQDCLRLK